MGNREGGGAGQAKGCGDGAVGTRQGREMDVKMLQQQHRMKYKDRWVCKQTHQTSRREQSLRGHRSREHCEFH